MYKRYPEKSRYYYYMDYSYEYDSSSRETIIKKLFESGLFTQHRIDSETLGLYLIGHEKVNIRIMEGRNLVMYQVEYDYSQITDYNKYYAPFEAFFENMLLHDKSCIYNIDIFPKVIRFLQKGE